MSEVTRYVVVTNYKSDSRVDFVTLTRENGASGVDSEAALKAGNFRGSVRILMKFFDSAAPGRVGKTTFPITARLAKRPKQKLEASKNDKDSARKKFGKVSAGSR